MATNTTGIKGGQQWTRVTGPNLCPENAVREAQNVSRMTDEKFLAGCKSAGVKVTKRQASKWNNKKGAAYNIIHFIDMNGFVPASV